MKNKSKQKKKHQQYHKLHVCIYLVKIILKRNAKKSTV